MPVTTVQAFLQLIEKSNLLSPEQLAELRSWPEQEPKTLAARMVQAGWITRWQAQMLLAGKWQFQLGKYTLLELVGVGGMGAVYKAVQPSIGRIVALKVMSRQLLKQPKSVNRFLREIRSAAAVDHPNIVRAIDADCDRDTYFLVMEFVTGRDLKSWIRSEHALPIGWSCECIRQAALGLEHAFEQGMVHRDIKPSNLLVTQNDEGGLPLVKILDLGLARFATETEDEGDLTRSGQVLGTPDYIAPEQARHTKSADIRADIFSLGCALFELLTGRLPFPGDTVMEKLMARASQDAPRVRFYRPEVPQELDDVVARMVARDPRERYATPAEVAIALAPFAIGTAGAARAPAATAARPQSDVSTGVSPAVTFASIDATTDGTLHGLDDLTRLTAEERLTPVSEPSPAGRHSLVRIVAGIVATILVAGMAWSIVPARKAPSSETADAPGHPHRKHKSAKHDSEHAESAGEAGSDEDPEHRTAAWILKAGGAVTVLAPPRHEPRPEAGAGKEAAGKAHHSASEPRRIHDLDDLPAAPVHVIAVEAPANVRLTKGDFHRLSKLPRLESLSLTGSKLSDADLAELKNAHALSRLDFQDTPLADSGISELRNLAKLQSLDLSRTRISGKALASLASLPTLTELALAGTQLADHDLSPLEGMPQLVALNLSGTRVRGPGLRFLKRLKNLTTLDLGGLPLQGIGLGQLRGLSNVQVLRLSGSRVTDSDLTLLSGMTSLRELFLDSTGVTGNGLKNLTWMAELEHLDVQDTVIGDDGLKTLREMKSLRSLNLRGTVVSDAGIAQLSELLGLESLDLSGTKVTRTGVDSLRQALPDCKIEY